MRHRLIHGALLLLAAVSLLAAVVPARAKAHLFVDVGWGNHYRAGRWSPIYVTLSDSAPRQVVVEVNTPTDRRYAVNIRQSLAIGPTDTTIPIYVPFSFQLTQSTVTVRDANSMSRLANVVLADLSAGEANVPSIPDNVPADSLFIGISGNGQTERLLEGQLQSDKVVAGYVPPLRLPAAPIGYDALDLLMLNAPDLNQLSADQQIAIADWVRAGGLLVLWLGAGPVPTGGPLLDILPCAIGENQAIAVDAAAIRHAGLPPRFASLKGRTLRHPAGDAKPIRLFDDANLTGYRHWVGDGQVAVLPVDVSMFTFTTPDHATAFWKQTLDGLTKVPQSDSNQSNSNQPAGVANPYVPSDSRHQIAMGNALDWIGNIPGAGKFGFGYLAVILLAMMVIVGPVDWFVLKWLGHQPWTWATITGWIGVVTFGGIYAGHLIRSGDVVFRTVTLIDEADGARVASLDLTGIYSPQTRRYELSVDPQSWWSPASVENYYGSAPLHVEIPCHQDYRGNRPESLLINIWNLRLLQARTSQPAALIIEAKLTEADGLIHGRIINHGPHALEHIRIRTRQGVATVAQSLPPGQSIEITQPLNSNDQSLRADASGQEAPDQYSWYRRNQHLNQQDRPRFPLLNALADRRAQRIDQMLTDRADLAVIYAESEGGNEDRILLNQPKDEKPASQAHISAVRAVVSLESAQH